MTWSNLARIVYRRTYARRKQDGSLENWEDTIRRAVAGNVKGRNVPEQEIKDLIRLGVERKAIPAGRGLWFSGTEAHERLGGVANCNCWYLNSSDWMNYVIAQDLLMLGGGVGLSVEHRFTSKLPQVKKDVEIVHKNTKDADFIIPDSREGWCELTRRILESYFKTGRSFSYSTICLRGYGELIKGFGGLASGPIPVINFATTLCELLNSREGRHIRPIDAADILTSIAQMVVSGNVRRSAIIIIGDPWDKEYLQAKRWDLATLPGHRACANYSVCADSTDDLHPLFWKTFDAGEAFGIINRKNIRKYGRMGELKKDTAEGVNPCGEACLEPFEPCNLLESALPNMRDEDEFVFAAKLMYRYGKRVTTQKYHHPEIQSVVDQNRRIGIGITGCLSSDLFNSKSLDRAYQEVIKEDRRYSKELNVPESIRYTVVKPAGTSSKVLDMNGYEGVHAAYSRYIIQRVRFSANDSLIPLLKEAGHKIEPVINLDGTRDQGTLVADFYVKAPDGAPVADEDYDTWKQLDTLMLAQRYWSDQAVSASIYYKRQDIPKIKKWLDENIDNIKTISFLCHDEHGFKQAPKEAITQEQFEKLSSCIKPIDIDKVQEGDLDNLECEGGVCPVK